MFRNFRRGLSGLLALLMVLLMAAFATPARADGLIVIHNPPTVVPGHFTFAPLEVVYHKVECSIDDQVAVTSVDQEFYNSNAARLEGTYIFPVPKDAQINKFSMDIDGKQVEAELLPADKARAIYEDIVRKSRDPALLEYAGRAMFKVRIFPIEPNSRKRVQLKYTELLKSDNNLMDYHYTLNTEKYSSKPLKNLSMKITVKSSQPITTLYSPTHEVEKTRHGENAATVGFEARDVRPDTDFHLFIGRKATPVGISVLTYKPDADKDGYFVLLAAPTLSQNVKPMPKDVVFVMDTSGSMNGDKILQAKKALKFCVNTLNPEDRFDIVRFSTEAEPFFKELRPVNEDTRKKALEFIEQMKASGGTAIQEALTAGLGERSGKSDERLFMLVFLTDGQPTIGEQNPDRILDKVRTERGAANVRIFSFGIGTDVNTKLLDQVAEQTKGYSQYVLEKEDIEVAVSNFFSKVQDPVLAGLKLDTGSVAASKLYPKELPDLFKGDQLVAFGTYSKGGSTAITLTGMVNGKAEKFVQDAKFEDKTDAGNDWIAKLWAVRRIAYLLDEVRLHGESKELKDEVTTLARQFGIVTPYTAMLIIEDERGRNIATRDRVLREMEADTTAMAKSATGMDSLRRKDDFGKQAVANSVNTGEYKRAESIEGIARAAEQRDSRMQFEGAGGASLDRGVASTPAPVAAGGPAAPGGGWVGAQVPAASVPGEAGSKMQANQGYRVVTNYAQQSRTVNNRAFYLNGNQWTDAKVQNLQQARRVKVQFNSQEYFDLVKKHPETAQWLALGNNVTFELNGEVYDVVEN